MYDKIVKLTNKLKSFADNGNESFRQRQRNVKLVDALVFRLLYSQKGMSQECVRSTINDHTGNILHRSSYTRGDDNVGINVYEDLYSEVCSFEKQIYGKAIQTVMAVDGTSSHMNIDLKNEGYSANKNGEAVTGMILGIHNVTRNYPIALDLVTHKDERRAFLDYINRKQCIPPNTIWVFDRGFYSLEFIDKLISKNLNFICRLRSNMDIIDANNNDSVKSVYINGAKHRLRIVKYTINDTEYYLATNLFDDKDYPIKVLADLYHDRWSVEELFKLLKSNTDLSKFDEKSSISIKKSIYCQLIIARLEAYLEHCYINDPKFKNKKTSSIDSRKVNRTNLISGLYSKFILGIFYKKTMLKDIQRFTETWIVIHNSASGRSYPRTCKTPFYKWYIKRYFKKYLKDGSSTDVT